MEFGEGKIEPGVLVELTDQQKRARKFRNIAIGLALAVMVAAFYFGSVARFSAKLGDRAAAVATDAAKKEGN